jgi:hypothetical protein
LEGLIAVDLHVAAEIDLPVASVELGYVMGSEMSAEDMASWLVALGESAADTIIRQVEGEGVSPRVNVNAKLSAAFFEMPGLGMRTNDDTRETA